MFSYNFIYIYTLCIYIKYKNYSYIHFTNYFYCTQIPKINLLKPVTILDHFIKPDLIKYLFFLYDISIFILIKCVYFDIFCTTVKYMLK